NIRDTINNKIDEFMRNEGIGNGPLPMYEPGGKLYNDQVGHIKKLMDAHDDFQKRIEEYTDKCGGPPPGIPISRSPTAGRSPQRQINPGTAQRRVDPRVVHALIIVGASLFLLQFGRPLVLVAPAA